MSSVEARITTIHARKYLRTLCNHWRHKFELEYADDRARIPFDGEARIDASADDAGLDVRVSHADAAQLPRLQAVVAEHLQRFARDETLAFEWAPSASIAEARDNASR